MQIIIDLSPQGANPLASILTPALISYTNSITFPWPISCTLSGSEVGSAFFDSQDSATAQWSGHIVKESLISLSKIGLSKIHLKDIIALLPSPSDLDFNTQVTGLILFLDQGPRYVCKGAGKRYIYEYFDIISRKVVGWLMELSAEENPFCMQSWSRVGISWDQAIVRISMLLAPLVHSEVLADMDRHLDIEEKLREEIEEMSGLKDPYRQSFRRDLKDEYLTVRKLLKEGPPKGESVQIEDFVWWVFRYFTGHVGIVERFGRSPWRNVAVGRDDTEHERAWLVELESDPSAGDEMVRKEVKEDVINQRWSELVL
jgi:uncharacterized protein (DUF924 family)